MKFNMERERGGADDATVLVLVGLIFLTLTSAVSAYRAAAAGDAASAAFVGVSYATLLLLFRRLRAYERLPPEEDDRRARLRREVWALRGLRAYERLPPPPGAADDARRRQLKRELWALCTMLTVLFSWKVAAAMPSWPVAAAVWAMAALTTAAGGYAALFHHHRRP